MSLLPSSLNGMAALVEMALAAVIAEILDDLVDFSVALSRDNPTQRWVDMNGCELEDLPTPTALWGEATEKFRAQYLVNPQKIFLVDRVERVCVRTVFGALRAFVDETGARIALSGSKQKMYSCPTLVAVDIGGFNRSGRTNCINQRVEHLDGPLNFDALDRICDFLDVRSLKAISAVSKSWSLWTQSSIAFQFSFCHRLLRTSGQIPEETRAMLHRPPSYAGTEERVCLVSGLESVEVICASAPPLHIIACVAQAMRSRREAARVVVQSRADGKWVTVADQFVRSTCAIQSLALKNKSSDDAPFLWTLWYKPYLEACVSDVGFMACGFRFSFSPFMGDPNVVRFLRCRCATGPDALLNIPDVQRSFNAM